VRVAAGREGQRQAVDCLDAARRENSGASAAAVGARRLSPVPSFQLVRASLLAVGRTGFVIGITAQVQPYAHHRAARINV
jgi:hypothetical protein